MRVIKGGLFVLSPIMAGFAVTTALFGDYGWTLINTSLSLAGFIMLGRLVDADA